MANTSQKVGLLLRHLILLRLQVLLLLAPTLQQFPILERWSLLRAQDFHDMLMTTLWDFSDRASVTVRSSRAHYVNAEGTELKARVPASVPDGDQELSVFDAFLGGQRGESADNQITIAISTRIVNNYTPTRGDIGDELTINGENFAVYGPFNTIIFTIPGVNELK